MKQICKKEELNTREGLCKLFANEYFYGVILILVIYIMAIKEWFL